MISHLTTSWAIFTSTTSMTTMANMTSFMASMTMALASLKPATWATTSHCCCNMLKVLSCEMTEQS